MSGKYLDQIVDFYHTAVTVARLYHENLEGDHCHILSQWRWLWQSKSWSNQCLWESCQVWLVVMSC